MNFGVNCFNVCEIFVNYYNSMFVDFEGVYCLDCCVGVGDWGEGVVGYFCEELFVVIGVVWFFILFFEFVE